MVENMLKRAKAFIGLGDEAGIEAEQEELGITKKDDIREVLRPKRTANTNADYEIMVYEPREYEDSMQMAAQLRDGNPVIVNLSHLDLTNGTRLIDFVCGTAYAIDGHMIKIGESIFLFTPNNIIISDFVDRTSIEQEVESADNARKSFFGGR